MAHPPLALDLIVCAIGLDFTTKHAPLGGGHIKLLYKMHNSMVDTNTQCVTKLRKGKVCI